jgi:hypothetical protein
MSFLQNAPVPQFQQQAAPAAAPQFQQQAPAPIPYGAPAGVRDPYAGMGQVQMKPDSLLPGQYTLKIVQCRDGNFPDAIGGAFFFASDFEVMQSTNPGCPPGKQVSWISVLHAKGKEAFAREIKAFLGAVANMDPKLIDDNGPRQAVSQANPCQGRIVLAEAVDTGKVSQKGNRIIKVKFTSPCRPPGVSERGAEGGLQDREVARIKPSAIPQNRSAAAASAPTQAPSLRKLQLLIGSEGCVCG